MMNRELDDFAFAAAHDLKAPLRVIDNASQWIEKDLGPGGSERIQRSLQLLRSRVARMTKLLDDLLQYSRIGRTAEAVAEIVTGGELIENVIALLVPPAGFRVEIDPVFAGMQVCRMPLQQILLNLVGNAIKHHHRQSGHIRITAEQRGAEQVFSVSDDGPGIPAAFHDKIFQMFTTLRPRDQVEGSGIGLAIVRKQVELSGGLLALESVEGHGSTFRFTLPLLPPAARRAS
jgi:signal transduction histidine kinase